MKVSFSGIGENIVTFEAASGLKAGNLVKVSANGTAAACAASGDVPLGVAVQVRDGLCGVQTQGYMRVPCASSTVVGFGLYACDSDKKLTKGTTGRPGFVLDVDSAAGVCGILF